MVTFCYTTVKAILPKNNIYEHDIKRHSILFRKVNTGHIPSHNIDCKKNSEREHNCN